jgi:hypothetical protein
MAIHCWTVLVEAAHVNRMDRRRSLSRPGSCIINASVETDSSIRFLINETDHSS